MSKPHHSHFIGSRISRLSILCLFVVVQLVFVSWSYSAQEKLSLIRISKPSPELVEQLQAEHLDIVFIVLYKRLDIIATSEDLVLLRKLGIDYTVVHDDLVSFLSNRAIREFQPDQGSMGGFHTLSEIETFLDDLHTNYPSIVSAKFSAGTSIEGRNLWVIKVSDNVAFDENEPEVFYNSLIHAREPAGMECLLYYLEYLTTNYGSDSAVTYLINNREFFFMPVVNPDGYEYNRQTNPNGGGMWRKNRRQNTGGSYGVDLNRNYGYEWGYDNIGSSANAGDDDYRGTGPFSEPETQVIRDFTNNHEFKTTLNYHTFSNLLIRPFGYDSVPLIPASDLNIYDTWGAILTRINKYEYGDPPSTVGYRVNGGADDWCYGERFSKPKIFSFTPEVGSDSDNFWPSPSRIEPLAQENLELNLLIAWLADQYCELTETSLNFTDQNGNGYPDGGEDAYLTFWGKTLGLNGASSLSVELSCDSPDVMIDNPTAIIGDTALLETFNNDISPYHINFQNNLQTGDKLIFSLTVNFGGYQQVMKTFSLIIGEPAIILFDDAESGMSAWTTNGTWATTEYESKSPTHSLTDSPVGLYPNNTTNRLTLIDSFDLTGLTYPQLTFWTKWEIEAGYDFGQVEVSVDGGTNWIPLEGEHTTAGSGDGVQNSGEPGYDGQQSTWVKEIVDLSDFADETDLLIRFELKSDTYLRNDGWYVDDITVLGYQVNQNVPTLSTFGIVLILGLLSYPILRDKRKTVTAVDQLT